MRVEGQETKTLQRQQQQQQQQQLWMSSCCMADSVASLPLMMHLLNALPSALQTFLGPALAWEFQAFPK